MKTRRRYRRWWYPLVAKAIKEYPYEADETEVAEKWRLAIQKAIEETKAIPETGELRLKAVSLIYINGTHSVYGASRKLFISERTCYRWLYSFVSLVGSNMGYE